MRCPMSRELRRSGAVSRGASETASAVPFLRSSSHDRLTKPPSRRCAMTTTYEGPSSPAITWGYRRKSSLQQSYKRQTKALHDLGIPEERVFEDALSGKTMNRPGWRNLMSHVLANDEVWVDGLDRLGRSTLVTLQAMEELEERGVRVRSAKPGEPLEGATGELIRQLMLVMAQLERRQMLERVAEARSARVAAGLPAGRPKTALADKQVRHVQALRAAGYSVRPIVADLGISCASVYRALALLATTMGASLEVDSVDLANSARAAQASFNCADGPSGRRHLVVVSDRPAWWLRQNRSSGSREADL